MVVDERELTSGLDALEAPAAPKVSRGRTIWKSTWPKLLAIAIFLGVWQFLIWIEWKPSFQLASPADTFQTLWDDWSIISEAMWTTLRRGIEGYAIAVVVGVVIGAAVARIPVLRAAIGSMITGSRRCPRWRGSPLRCSCSN
jgi:NitT/TauT family transport system permease protein